MQKTILMIMAVALVGCASPTFTSDPSNPQNVIVEAAIRRQLNEPTGELTKADLEKVTMLNLDFDKNLDDNQLTSVKGLEKLTQLEHLNLGRNKLTELPEGLEKLTQLKHLSLGANQLTSVKGLEKLTQLKYLFLHDNQLTSVKGLEKLTQLKHLSLGNNPALTKAQIDELKKALPKCRITHSPLHEVTAPSLLPIKLPQRLGNLDARL